MRNIACKPNFLIVGVQKAGTTSLADWLEQHPEIYLPKRIKEPFFFTYAGQKYIEISGRKQFLPRFSWCWNDYLKLFYRAQPYHAIGEASTLYFHSPQSPGYIKFFLPNVKLIVVLRDPIDRAYSHYLMAVRNGFTINSFEQSLATEMNNYDPAWWYKRAGLYMDHLRRYLHFFDHKQIKVFLFEDLVNDPNSMYLEICNFLEVDSAFQPVFSHKNSFGNYHYQWVRKRIYAVSYENLYRKLARTFLPNRFREFIHKELDKFTKMEKPTMDNESRNHLQEYYRSQIEELQDWLGRDLSNWMRD